MRHSPCRFINLLQMLQNLNPIIGRFILISIIYIQMQVKDIDTLKFCISLLRKLKNNETIDINNKLINVGIDSITCNQLKLLIQTESRNDTTFSLSILSQIGKKVQIIAKESEQNLQETRVNKMIELKIKALILMKEMKSNDANLAVITAHQLFTLITCLQEMKYVLGLLFRVKSLISLEKIDIRKINTTKLNQKQKEALMFMLVLVKLQPHPVEAKDILATHLNGKYIKEQIQKDKQAVLSVIKVLLEREKELLKKSKKSQMIEESSNCINNIQTTKKQIRNKFYNQFKIDLQQPREECQRKIAALNQASYLLAQPLFNYYQQTNQNVISDIQRTKINRKISNPSNVLNSSILNSSASKEKSKLEIKYMKNPEQYSKYLKVSSKYSQECAKDCAFGQYFVKHNFNNLKSSLKYVVLNKEKLYWGKNKSQIFEDSTAVKIKNIAGILYGKVSSRLEQCNDSGLCFSILLKDRTVDLQIDKEKQDQSLRRFVLGASFVIGTYHTAQRQKWRVQKQIKKGEKQIQQINTKINYHEHKIRQVTLGKLLWRDIFNSLANKTNRFQSQLFTKSKLLIHFAKVQPKSQKKASSQSENKKIVF